MAHDRERSKQRKMQDSDRDSTRFAEAAGEGVSGNEVFGLDRVDTARRSERRRPEDSATWSGTASPEERPVHKDMINNPENFDAASRSTGGVDASPREDVSRGAGSDNASSNGPSSFYGRARQRRAGSAVQRRARVPRTGREEDMSMPSAQDIARGYGVDRNDFYGSRSSYTLGAETDADFARRAEAESPYYGDNLGAGADYGSEGSDLGPGIGANRAFGYGAAPSFGSMSPRDSASSIGYDVGYGPPAFGEHATLRGRPATEQSRIESHRGASSRTQQGGRPQPRETGRGSRASGDYPEAGFEQQRYTEERARASDQPFDRGSIWGTVNLPPTGSPGESAARAPRRSRWRREPLEARDVMTRDVKSVHPDTSLRDAVRIMRDQNTGIVPVVNADDVLQGVVTDRDIVMRSVAEGRNPAQLTAADVMTHDIDAATPDESVVDVVHLMGTRQVRRVPVVDQNDRLVGIISMADIATRADYDAELQDALEEISLRRSFWRE